MNRSITIEPAAQEVDRPQNNAAHFRKRETGGWHTAEALSVYFPPTSGLSEWHYSIRE
ncbi:MAG: hypothetical protein ACTIDX_07985 [Hafnia paralvei]|uniref:hypothetical protein n=1 Tax=Hafnia paralvei TaxID=546367 RepID=UPI001585942C|nr:hypothetical protein [Hafnia paralvei]MCE9880434.1 hypothetical protein [Hafnia paralvei]MCE9906198.1 hypothetical protein [Hafnia paralvei]MCE9910759.1 hypothetical protein [Hafnia paralvei]NUN42321.1 hypothetical protein [Hafnia paralvei]